MAEDRNKPTGLPAKPGEVAPAVDVQLQQLEILKAMAAQLGLVLPTQAPSKPSLLVREVWEAYELAEEEEHRTNGWKSIKSKMVAVLKFFGDRSVDSLNRKDKVAYFKWRVGQGRRVGLNSTQAGTIGKTTATVEFKRLMTVLSWLRERGDIEASPLAGIKFKAKKADKKAGGETRKRKEKKRVYTDAEVERLIRTARLMGFAELVIVMTVMRWSGVRPGELWVLHWADVDLDNGLINIPDDVAKTGVARSCLLASDAQAALEAWAGRGASASGDWLFPPKRKGKEGPMSYQGLWQHWNLVWQAADIGLNADGSKPKLYHFRHTLATKLGFELFWNETQIADWMGWENPAQARSYVHPQQRHREAQLQQIEQVANPRSRDVSQRSKVTHIGTHVRFGGVTSSKEK